ncbi:MAG: S41 family peptidase [Lachnospiraceae bacterium]|nr:S41 family peptidase [Lachnospiraceae bacterium]
MEELEQEKQNKPTGSTPSEKSHYIQGLLTGLASMMALLLVIFLVVWKLGFISVGSYQGSGTGSLMSQEVQDKIELLYTLVESNYYEDVDDQELVNGIYHGLLEGLGDPYSVYYTQEEYEDMMISTTGNYYGIGALLGQDPDTMVVTINHIYDGTPAKKAGLKDGDIIVEVNDMEATSMELSQLVTHIRGEEGTTVHLKIYREGEADYLEFDVERAQVDIPTVESQMLTDEIGYIQVTEFSENTPEQFENAISDLQSQGMKKMIIDLRDNGGGILESCRQMLDVILPEGVVVYTEDKYGDRENYYSDEDSCLDMPIVVLVNGNSASASEIFAGAIRDFDYGTLIGTKTFGKGIVQNVRQLSDGSAVKMTIARYFTPNGDYIHGVGIEPDIELEYEYSGDTESDEYDYMADNQVVKAIEVLEQ